MSEDQKKQLQAQLWNIANELRGRMDADEFRDYILGFIFYKYLSEKLSIYANQLLASDNKKYEKLDLSDPVDQKYVEAVKTATIEHLGYFLTPGELFNRVAVEGNVGGNLVERLEKTLNDIEQSTMGSESEEDFEKLFSELDLNATKLGKTVSDRSELIAKVLVHLNNIDFRLEDSEVDILGDAYEYLIGQFASGAGKKAGEFYTPQEISTVLARLVTAGKKQLKTVYDPTCGSGSLLLRVAKYVKEVGHFYGQELNNTTYNLARMNMILHDVNYSKFDISQEDTLEHPQHLEYRFEAIVANPPFSAKWSANPIHMDDERFAQYGKLAPSSKADYAFIEHMIYQLDDNGTMATVMPHGVLFRGAAEGHIRKYLIKEKNYLDAVIGLPSNLFYGTSIPACILVFKKCREDPDNILFIDASKHFEKGKNQNHLRPEDIDKIIQTFNDRQDEDKYSHLASLEEIKENDYNLNIPRYVDTFEEEEEIDLNEVTKEIKTLETKEDEINKRIATFTKELGIESPFGEYHV
ncbi:MAG: type I restriction-modification system subunit M [Patescibacteria group bacterium]|jgi:type I restriction enzyme M protein|nr:type I restriction-modification system subunit M [Patescibacteria group bacterium]